MSHLRYVTLTGVDENTDLDALTALSAQHPFAEWGVLYSQSRAGNDPRYPSLDWIARFADLAAQRGLNVALHLCGDVVPKLGKALLDFDRGNHQCFSDPALREVFDLAGRFDRVQLNGTFAEEDVPWLRAAIPLLSRTELRTRVILQWNDRNEEICKQAWGSSALEVLVDSSGGNGIERTDWPSVGHHFPRAGYAGGLGPDNLAEQLPRIAKAASNCAFSVDMESKLRDEHDRFDLQACARVLQIAAVYDAQARLAAGARYGNERVLVQDLKGLWLDWWVGHVLGYDMVVPPQDACRAVYLDRPSGRFENFSGESEAIRLLHREKIALTPLDVFQGDESDSDDETDEGIYTDAAPKPFTWAASAMGDIHPTMFGASLVEAGLRAIVAKHVGPVVNSNPMADLPL